MQASASDLDAPQPVAAAVHSEAPSPSVAASAALVDAPPAAASSAAEHSVSVIMHGRDVYKRAEEEEQEEAPEIELQTVRIHTLPASLSATAVASSSSLNSFAVTPAASPSAAAAAAPPSAAQWQSELRLQWESGALRAAQEKPRPKPLPYRPPLSPAVLAQPPLNGDVVWNRGPLKPVSVSFISGAAAA